ncbi:MAG TPA: peptidoglycan-associated outer membrane lipoprotein precursor [Lysobacter sp.]|nr:peptidoglycan-associated outer membrane lipoprotein precursor [Lysobacter sp.]
MKARTNYRLLGLTAAAAMALAGCASSPSYTESTPSGGYYGGSTYGGSTADCYDCGTVVRIEQAATGGGAPRGTGAVLGGVVGAAAAREIADDRTDSEGRKNTATVAGAVAGAVAGNAIQNRVGGPSYAVHVRMNDGRTVVVNQRDVSGLREGSYVRVYNGRVWPR